MSKIPAEQTVLREPLATILRSELNSGNEISVIQRGGWSKVDIVVSLKLPFRKDYQDKFEGAEFYRYIDTHYPLSESYPSANNRESIEAPY